MVKKVNDFLLTSYIDHKYLVKVRPFSSAKVSCINNHVKPTVRAFNTEHIIQHVGTNDLNTERTASRIESFPIIKTDVNTITVSLIVPKYDNLIDKANEVNSRLINMCKERKIPYIYHADAISPERHLNQRNLQLNRHGILVTATGFEPTTTVGQLG